MNKIPDFFERYFSIESGAFRDNVKVLERTLSYASDIIKIIGTFYNVVSKLDLDEYSDNIGLFLEVIQDGICTGFTLLIRGHPKQALLCFRPAIESIGYAWHMYKDKKKVDIWIETHRGFIEGERKKHYSDLFYKSFKKPRFPSNNWPMFELRESYRICSETGAHSQLGGMVFTDPFVKDPLQVKLQGIFLLKMTRHICAIMGEICTKSFSSDIWKSLDITVLREAVKYVIREGQQIQSILIQKMAVEGSLEIVKKSVKSEQKKPEFETTDSEFLREISV